MRSTLVHWLQKKMPHFMAFTWPIAILYFIVYCVFISFPPALCGLYTRYDILLICLHIWTMKITTRMPGISWSIYDMWLTHMAWVVAILTRNCNAKRAKRAATQVVRWGQIGSGHCVYYVLHCHNKTANMDLCQLFVPHTSRLSVCLSIRRLFN